jgi:hypothetical protein
MRTTVRTVLIFVSVAAIFLLACLVLFGYWSYRGASAAERVEDFKLCLEAFKVIVVSFFVSLIGILIPARVREVRYIFQRMKESRIAYSEAKTGVAYLPIQLCSLNFSDSATLIQRVHFQKHQAELYEDLDKHAKHLGVTGRIWADKHFQRLVAFRTVLEDHTADWDALTRNERIKYLLDARRLDRQKQERTRGGDIIG